MVRTKIKIKRNAEGFTDRARHLLGVEVEVVRAGVGWKIVADPVSPKQEWMISDSEFETQED